jgi:protease-4
MGVISHALQSTIGRLTSDGLEVTVLQPGRDDQVVAVYEVFGMINSKQTGRFRVFRDSVSDDPNVKAVVLRVASPGGGISACDGIHKMLTDLKSDGKKIVVSMGAVAASGGYYISAPSDAIYAEPTTVTGSIGVLSGWVVIKGTLEKYGAKAVIVRSTKTRAWKATMNPFEDPADYQIESIRKLLDVMQERFEKVVCDGRGKKLKTITAEKTYTDAKGKKFTITETLPFNGNIFTAAEALDLGLIDNVGYLDDAIDQAASLAGLSDPKVLKYTMCKGLLEQLAGAKAGPIIDPNVIDEIQTPKLMMIWKIEP